MEGIEALPERGVGDVRALERALRALRAGAAVCVFPEGKLSRGRGLRARSGIGRLATDCPGVTVVLCAVEGTTDYARFPKRPRVTVTLFRPAAGQPPPDEEPTTLAARLLGELRERVPPAPAGRG